MSQETQQVEAVRNSFDAEYQRFTDLVLDGSELFGVETMLRELSELKIAHTGKRSALAESKKLIGRVPADERASFGQIIQSVEQHIVGSIESTTDQLNAFIVNAKIEAERVDVTQPGRRPRQGHLHPVTIVRQKIEDIFVAMGYTIENDREIETDHYNFEALNLSLIHI